MNVEQVVQQLQWRCQGKYRLRKYVTGYVTNCLTFQRPVELVTLWCLSKGLEQRRLVQQSIKALPKEQKVIGDFVWCHSLFTRVNILVNHYIFLVGSAVERGAIGEQIKLEYQHMLTTLVGEAGLDAIVELRSVAVASTDMLKAAELKQAGDAMFVREVERRLELAIRHHYPLSKEQAEAEALKSVATKAQEAAQLAQEFGDFLLIPVEFVERYYFHNWGCQGFTERLIPITQPYPWRLSD